MDYQKLAKEIRREVLTLIYKGQTSHTASNFSLIDIVTVLYENLTEKDLVLWSKGWAAALFYVMNIRRGVFNKEEVYNTFPNHPYPALLEPPTPLTYVPTGSVGHGLPVAVGMAYAKKLKGESGKVYCILSDGELNEGSVWEAVMLAAHLKLDNLVAIIDKNGWQAMGKTEEVINLNSEEVFRSFGWWSNTIDGHDYKEIELWLESFHVGKPAVIIANTIKGKGVSFMEDHLLFHYRHIDDQNYIDAMEELK